jgi:hypothetical protein
MSAYLNRLIQEHAARVPASRTAPLEERFLTWFNSLPEFTRDRPFSMQEFEKALGVPGRLISPVLLRLNWRRHRQWKSTGQYHRYWLPSELARQRVAIREK